MSSAHMPTASLFESGKSMAGRQSPGVLVAYIAFAGAGWWVYHVVAEQSLSGILTLAVMIQCLSFVLLGLKVASTRSAAGISARTLGIDALSISCRLSSTLWLDGYLPVDASGDFIYQAADLGSLTIVGYLLWQVLVVRRGSYQESSDSCTVWILLVVALVLSCLFHADQNHYPLFDILWTFGLFLDAIAMIPQVWLIAKSGGAVEALTSHYIATNAVSRLLGAAFWYIVMDDMACDKFWIQGFKHGSWGILAAHAVHFLLLADFVYYYAKACVSGRLPSGLPMCVEV